MLPRIVAVMLAVSLCLLGVILTQTTPATAGAFGLLILFISAYLAFVGLISFFLYGVSRVLVYATRDMTFKRPLRVIAFSKAYYYAFVLAGAPIMLVSLQSVGSVGWYETLLVIGFVVLGSIYVNKRL